MSAEFKIRKFANALSTSAQLTSGVAKIPVPGEAVQNATDTYRQRHGGVWVGGVLEVSDTGIDFEANSMNKALTPDFSSTLIHWRDVSNVTWHFGLLTGIVVVKHANGDFRFRCFGAKGVARKMSEHLVAL